MESQKRKEEIAGKIREQFPEIKFPEPILEQVYFGRFEKKLVDGKRLIMDADTGTQWDVVSDKYQIKFHEETIEDLMNSLPPEYGKPELNIRLTQEGARMDVEAIFPDVRDEINGSKIDPMIRIKNSYNRTVNVLFEFGAYELICTNGLVSFKAHSQNRARHIQGSLTKLQLEKEIRLSLEDFSMQKDIWKSWAKKQVDNIQVMEVVKTLPFSEKESESLLLLPLLNHNKMTVSSLLEKKKATLWDLNSAATQMAAHEISSETRKIDIQGKIAKAIHWAYKKL